MVITADEIIIDGPATFSKSIIYIWLSSLSSVLMMVITDDVIADGPATLVDHGN